MARARTSILEAGGSTFRGHLFIVALFTTGQGTVACSATTPLAAGYPIGTEQARPIILGDAERDLDCPGSDILVKELWGGLWEARGCGQKMRYTANCDSIRCEVHREDEAAVPFRDRPEPQEMPR